MSVPSKTCASCGRSFEYRKRWAKNWADVKYCSDECRRNKTRFDYRAQILAKLQNLARGTVLKPQDFLEAQAESPAFLEHVRRSARLLAAEGLIEILQNGKVVDPNNVRGEIGFRLS